MWEPFGNKDSIERIAEAVRSAPSVFGSQPWSLRIVASDRIELRASYGEYESRLRMRPDHASYDDRTGTWANWAAPKDQASPLAREYAISCGAALYNLRLAIRATGHEVNEWLLPYPEADPGLLASVEIVTSRTKEPSFGVQKLYEAMWVRHTSRWPYMAPVPAPLLVEMELAAAKEHAWLRLMHKAEARAWLRKVTEADKKIEESTAGQAPRFRDERDVFLRVSEPSHGPSPENAEAPLTRHDFWIPGRKARFESPQLMSLGTDNDRPLDWLRAGMALQRAILTATRYSSSGRYGIPVENGDKDRPWYGVAVSFLTQPLEADDIQPVPRHYPWHNWSWWGEVPQMVMRVGYAPVVPVTPHRIRDDDVTDVRR